jgi:hypothetical protein
MFFGGGGVASMARTASLKVPVIGGTVVSVSGGLAFFTLRHQVDWRVGRVPRRARNRLRDVVERRQNASAGERNSFTCGKQKKRFKQGVK